MNWTATEIAHIAGIEYRTLHSWRRRGLITPSIHNPSGSGNTALYSDDDLARAVVLAAMRPFLTLEGLALLSPASTEGSSGAMPVLSGRTPHLLKGDSEMSERTLTDDVNDVIHVLREYVAKPTNQDDGMAHAVLDKLERAVARPDEGRCERALNAILAHQGYPEGGRYSRQEANDKLNRIFMIARRAVRSDSE